MIRFDYSNPQGGSIPEPDVLAFSARMIAAVFARTMLASCFNFRINGRENLPARGPFVMVANHSSHLDASCLMAALPLPQLRRAYPAAAADYFFSSPARSAFARLALNALPFARDRNIRQSLRMCHAVLDAGAILIIFPEGTRSTTGMRPFKPGIGQIVAGKNVPVVPCYIDGAARAWPKQRWLPRPYRLRVTIGEAMTFTDVSAERDSYNQIARGLEEAVRSLGAL